ncbi:DUF6012 family protein [Escherichia coli]|uniref:DUF6012 family protein n=1 Tax=Escherichia coli TaxID=562 RepID=UPI003CF6B6E8
MYLHLVPRILHHMKNKCTLMSVSVPELSLELKADSLVAMKPYPNKTYHVGMLKGRRALNGFLVKSPRTLAEFTMKWFTEFGHLNRGDMLTSEQHRCHNEKKKFQRRV